MAGLMLFGKTDMQEFALNLLNGPLNGLLLLIIVLIDNVWHETDNLLLRKFMYASKTKYINDKMAIFKLKSL